MQRTEKSYFLSSNIHLGRYAPLLKQNAPTHLKAGALKKASPRGEGNASSQ